MRFSFRAKQFDAVTQNELVTERVKITQKLKNQNISDSERKQLRARNKEINGKLSGQ